MKLRSIRGVYLIPLVGSAILLLGFQNCSRPEGFTSSVPANRQQAAASTEQLLKLQQDLKQANDASQTELLQLLQDQAEQRQQLLAELALNDPAAALRASLPESLQNQLPEQIQDKVERSLQVEGILDISYEDFPNGEHRLRHFLRTSEGKRLELSFAQNKLSYGNGKKVHVEGTLFSKPDTGTDEGVLALADGDSNVVWLDNDGTNTVVPGDIVPSVEYSLGEQRTLMIMVNFSDKPEEPWTLAEATTMFNTLDAYIRENSAGRTWLSGSVAGWYTIAQSITVCDAYDLSNLAKTAATQSGYNLNDYDRLFYVHPKNACGYTGSGSLGGQETQSFINGQFDLHNLAHEFGHNIGLDHAHALNCGATTIGSSCSSIIYGDSMDVLGKNNGSQGHYNPFNKQRLGWLKESEVLQISSSGLYSILPYSDLAVNGARVLKVTKSDDPNNWYYVGFHQPVGFEANLLDGSTVNVANITNGVVVHRAGSNRYSDLLDMTPESGGSVSDWWDPALVQGLSFSDPAAGLTLTTASVSSQIAQVDVRFSTPVCSQNNPSMQIAAPVTQWGSPGQSLTYSVTLTNNDSSSCSSRIFNLQASLPSGWSSQFGSANLNLAPGQSSSTNLTVTSAANATAGYYDVSVSTSQSPAASAILTYVLQAINLPPVAVNDNVTITSKSSVNINVLANDSDPEGGNLSVVSVTQGAKGSVNLNSNGTVTYTPGKAFKSSDQFSYTISDGQSTASATVFITLQATSGGGGRK